MLTMTADPLKEQLTRFAAGDRPAFIELHAALAPCLYPVILSVLRDSHESEDILQAVFVEAFTHPEALAQKNDVTRFLQRVARNKALDRKKYLRLRRNASFSDMLHLAEKTGRGELQERDLQRLQELLARLGDEEYEAVMLHNYGELSFPETAQLLGVTQHVARYRYEKAVAQLKEWFHELES